MSIPKMMRAAVVEEHGKPLVLKDIPVPEPGDQEVLVKIEVTGVCHTDIHVQDGEWDMKSPLPIIPGHEGVGRVVKLGPNVTGVKVGDRVCTPFLYSACRRCDLCCDGWETLCDELQTTGFTKNGSFAEYMVQHADYVGRVPEDLSTEQCGPITCAGVTVYKGLKVTEVKPGQWVVIVGAGGGLGHLAIQYAKAMGMNVVALDAGSDKIDFMKSLGADVALDVKTCDVTAEIVKATGGGTHGSLVLVPVPTAVQDAVNYSRKRATIVQIALPKGDLKANIFDVVLKAVTIRGSLVGTRLDLKESLQWAAEGKVKCNIEVRGFSEVNAVLDQLRSGSVPGRIVLDMSK